MEDHVIVELYWERNEKALEESEAKYGAYLRSLTGNILQSQEDGSECVNDTWLRAWNSIPPERPLDLRLYLARIARNLAIDRFRKSSAKKRGGGETEAILNELSAVVPDASRAVEAKELSESINAFIRALPRREGDILIRRYFFAERVDAIAKRYRMSANAVSASLARSRKKLAEHLKKEGFLE